MFNPVNPLDAGFDWAPNQRDHRKLLLVDGRTALLGGINISSVYSGGSFAGSSGSASGRASRKVAVANAPPLVASPALAAAHPAITAITASAGGADEAAEVDAANLAWRDTDLQLQGPAVAELQKLFLAAWAQQQGPTLAAKAYFPVPEAVGRQVVLGTEFGAQVQAMFDRDLAGSDAELLPAWQQHPLQLRVKELLARVWAYGW